MSETTVTFSEVHRSPNSKLSRDIFFTLRRTDDYPDEGETVDVRIGEEVLGRALLLLKVERKLKDVPTEFLLEDTSEDSRGGAIALLNHFYPAHSVTEESEFTILFFRWERRNPPW